VRYSTDVTAAANPFFLAHCETSPQNLPTFLSKTSTTAIAEKTSQSSNTLPIPTGWCISVNSFLRPLPHLCLDEYAVRPRRHRPYWLQESNIREKASYVSKDQQIKKYRNCTTATTKGTSPTLQVETTRLSQCLPQPRLVPRPPQMRTRRISVQGQRLCRFLKAMQAIRIPHCDPTLLSHKLYLRRREIIAVGGRSGRGSNLLLSRRKMVLVC
jgi:hypothetical protein